MRPVTGDEVLVLDSIHDLMADSAAPIGVNRLA